MMYFYYEQTPFGTWAAAKSDRYPTDKHSDGSKRRAVKRVTELKSPEDRFCLDALERIYPEKAVDQELQST